MVTCWSLPGCGEGDTALVEGDLRDRLPAEAEGFGDATIAPSVLFVEFSDSGDGFVRDRGIVVGLADSPAVLVVGDEGDHFLRLARMSARTNFLATFMGTPTFFANFLEWAAARINLACAGDLLGIRRVPWG